ncbi:MAG TPA: tetratricopeptide repeat protein [Pirellulales bacterium]|jgi:tetratricopeptide (TPR) repeat protein|nr:tetratricopeptide repeat protein [Pirellulales bacterium]
MSDLRTARFAVASVLFFAFAASAAATDAAVPDSAALPAEWRGKALLVKSPTVRLREQPDDQAAPVDLSLYGIWLYPRRMQGDWLRVKGGWLKVVEVLREHEVLDYFTDELKRSESAFGYVCRARAWIEKNEFDKAEADLSEALRLDPRCARAYFVRSAIAREQGRSQERLGNLRAMRLL